MITVSNFILLQFLRFIRQSAHALVDPGRVLAFAQGVAPRNGGHTLPALVEERDQIRLGLACTDGILATHEAGGPAGAQLALAGAHADARAAAQIDQIVHREVFECILHLADRNLLAFAHQAVLDRIRAVDARGQRPVAGDRRTPLGNGLVAGLAIDLLAALGRARQRDLGRAALPVVADLLADEVGGPLGHQAVGHQLAARDGDEALHPVARGVVEQHDAAADRTATRIVVRGHQRTHPGVGPQDARAGQQRRELLAFAQQQVHLVGRDDHVVDLVVGNLARRGADERDRIARHEDVGVGRLAAAVEHHTVHTVAEDQQRPLGREHVHRDAGLGGDAVAPDAAGIDHHLRAELQLGMRAVVVGLHTDDAVLLADELPDFGIGADLGAVRRGVEDVRRGQPEGIHRAVGDADRADQRRIGRRLQPPGLLGIEDVGPDTGLAAGLDKRA